MGWIGKYLRQARGAFIAISLLGVVRIASSLLFVYASKCVIDIATGASGRDFSIWAAVMAGAIVVDLTIDSLTSRIEKISSQKLQNTLRRTLSDHLLKIVWQGRDRLHSADTINRLERDVRDVSEFVCTQLPTMLVTALRFCAAFVFLLMLDKRLGWLLVGVVPLFLLMSKLWYARLKRLTHSVRKSDSKIQAHLQESVSCQVVIKTHNAERVFVERLDGLQDMLFGQTLAQTQFTFYSRLILSLGFAAGYLLTFIYGAWQIEQGVITYGVMVAFLQLVSQIQRPVAQLASAVPQFSTAATAVDRLDEITATQVEVSGGKFLFSGVCGLSMTDLTFRYEDGDRLIFDCFSYDFAPSSRTIITGATGAGKTTLMRLMLALVRPTSGAITIYNDRGDRATVSAAVRGNFVYVPQGNSLFSGSIRSNLLLSNGLASDDEICRAIHTAVAEFVYDLPYGIDTDCAEAGATLSEGQAQRIAIARALLGGGSVMLFDEFTSALDAATEQELIVRLSENYSDRTMIFITHRPEIFSRSGFANCEICH